MTVYSFPWVPIQANAPTSGIPNLEPPSGTVLEGKFDRAIFNMDGLKPNPDGTPYDLQFPDRISRVEDGFGTWKLEGFSIRAVNPSKTRNVYSKFRNSSTRPSQYPNFAIYQELIRCELVIDGDLLGSSMEKLVKNWGEPGDKMWSELDEWERTSEIIAQAQLFHHLVHLRGFLGFHTPLMLIGTTVGELASAPDDSVSMIALNHRPMAHNMIPTKSHLSEDDVRWILRHHNHSAVFFDQIKVMKPVSVALNSLVSDLDPIVVLATMWSALESLVRSPSFETRQSMAKRLAIIISDRGIQDKEEIFREVLDLWKHRCAVIHGKSSLADVNILESKSQGTVSDRHKEEINVLERTIDLFRVTCQIMIEKGVPFSKDELVEMQERFDSESAS